MSSSLEAFLKPVEIEQTKEIVVSKRFKDPKTGKPAVWQIKSFTQDVNAALRKRFTTKQFKKGQWVENFDEQGYQREVIMNSVVVPDLKDEKLCSAWGTTMPSEVVEKMLYPGEYADLIDAILELCGFDNSDVVEEAKN